MRPGLIVERQIRFPALMRRPNRLVGVQIHLLVCEAFSASFHEPVVLPTPVPVHADLTAVVGETPGELLAGQLAPLIGREDLRRTIADHGLLPRVQTEVGRHRVGETPGQHPATRPVQDRKHVH